MAQLQIKEKILPQAPGPMYFVKNKDSNCTIAKDASGIESRVGEAFSSWGAVFFLFSFLKDSEQGL